MQIGEVISNYLQDNGLSQRQFAKRCGLSNGYISMLINNKNPRSNKPITPSLTSLLAVSNALGMTLDQLLIVADDIEVDISATKNLPAIHNNDNGRAEEFVELFSKLTDEQQLLIIAQIKGILSTQ